MYLSQTIIKKGFFYSPADCDKKYPGVLTISDGGGVELELTADDSAFTSFEGMEIGRLIGLVEGGYVTLEGCGYRNKSISLGLPATSRIEAHMAFDGAGMPEPGEFLSTRFSVDGLSEWWNRSAFKFDHGEKFEDFKLSIDIPTPVEFSLQDNTRFQLSLEAKIPGGRKFPTLELFNQAYIQITSAEPKPFEYFLDLSHRITRFFALVIGRPVAIHSLKAKLDAPELDSLHSWLSVYFRSLNYPSRQKGKPLRTHDMLLSYTNIGTRLESMLSGWLKECDNLGPALHHYYLIQDGASSFADTKFISMAQALEAFHRRTSNSTKWPKAEYDQKVAAIIEGCPDADKNWLKQKLNFGNEITLAERLEQMFSPYLAVFGGEKAVADIIRKTKNTRNYHAHYDPKGARKAVRGAALVALTFRLQVLFTLCVVVRLGSTVEEALNIAKTGPLARLLQSATHIDEDS